MSAQPLDHPLVVLVGKGVAAVEERKQPVVCPRLFAGLGEHDKHLQIAEVARTETVAEISSGMRAWTTLGKFAEPWIAGELAWIDVEAPGHEGLPLVVAEFR